MCWDSVREFILFPPHSAVLPQHAITCFCSDWAPLASECSCVELWWCRNSATSPHNSRSAAVFLLSFMFDCQICDGTSLDGPTKRKGCIWCIVNNVRWERRSRSLYTVCSCKHAGAHLQWTFAGRNQMLKSMQAARAPRTVAWLF